MSEAEQIRSDLLDAMQRMKEAHHALADGRLHAALVHADVALATLGDARTRLARLPASPSTSAAPAPAS